MLDKDIIAARKASPFIVTTALAGAEISNLLVSAFEGGSNFWVHSAEAIGWTRPEGHRTPWYDDKAFVSSPDFKFKITYDDPDGEEGAGGGEKVIDRDAIIVGLHQMAFETPHSLGEILNDNSDAVDADNFLQCVVLGSVVYG